MYESFCSANFAKYQDYLRDKPSIEREKNRIQNPNDINMNIFAAINMGRLFTFFTTPKSSATT